MAIYLHFPDKQSLLDAAVQEVLDELDPLLAAAAAAAADPIDALCVQASAYVEFAMKHPVHYRYATQERRRSADGTNTIDPTLGFGGFVRHRL